MSRSLEQLRKLLTESGLLTEEELRAFEATTEPGDVDDLAAGLLRAEKITKFQADVLLGRRQAPLALGNYIVLDKIGEGGMGQVYKALHRRMERIVALKILPRSATESETAVKRFQREVKAASQLQHPNIVVAYDADEADGLHFLVMEYVRGRNLSQVVKENGPLPVETAVEYTLQIARGLEYAHDEGIVHRDIKPRNLLLKTPRKQKASRSGSQILSPTVKILDMGLALWEPNDPRIAPPSELTQSGAVMGTADYMSPEQAEDTHSADARSDIYSLGCTLYFLLTGHAMYRGDTLVKKLLAHRNNPIPSLREASADVSDRLEAIYRRMVAKSPEERYPNMTAVIAELQDAITTGQQATSTSESSPSTMTATAAGINDDSELREFLHTQSRAETRTQTVAHPQTITFRENEPANAAETLVDQSAERTIPSIGERSYTVGRKKSASRKGLFIGLGLLAVGIAIVAGVIFNLKTPNGTIVLEFDQADMQGAVVSIDDKHVVTIKNGKGEKPITVEADGKKRMLKVTKSGFETFAKEFSLKKGGKKVITVRLVPLKKTEPGRNGGTPKSHNPNGKDFALRFDGRKSYVKLPTIAAHTKPPITFEAYAILDRIPKGLTTVIERGGNMGIRLAEPRYGSRWNVSWGVADDKHHNIDRKAAAAPNKRVHLAAVWSEKNVRFFVDGVLHGTKPTGALLDRPLKITIGALAPKGNIAYQFPGVIDEVRISNTARYDGNFTPKKRFASDKNTLALYHFDEGEGDRLTDHSGNGHHGKIHNAAWVNADGSAMPRETPAVANRRAAEAVLNIGGKVTVFNEHKSREITKVADLPRGRFRLNSVTMPEGMAVPASTCKAIGRAKALHLFYANGCRLDDASLKDLARLDGVRSIYNGLRVSDGPGLQALMKSPRLFHLVVSGGTKVDDRVCLRIANLRQLRGLGIGDTAITDDGLRVLAGMRNLRSLSINNCKEITPKGITHLSGLKSLTFLNLAHTELNDDVVPALVKLSKVRLLDLQNTKISDVAAKKVAKALPGCAVLHPGVSSREPERIVAAFVQKHGGKVAAYSVSSAVTPIETIPKRTFTVFGFEFRKRQVTGAQIAALPPIAFLDYAHLSNLQQADRAAVWLGQLKSLNILGMNGSDLTDAGVEKLKNLTMLERLSLQNCKGVTDRGIASLTGMKQLWTLSLYGSQLSDTGMRSIAQLSSLTDLSITSCRNVTIRGLAETAKLPLLRYLNLSGNRQFTDQAVPTLSRLKMLRVLVIHNTGITEKGVARLRQALPDCFIEHESLDGVKVK